MNFLCLVFLMSILSMVLVIDAHAAETEGLQARQQECKFEAQVVRTVRLGYLLFLPKGTGTIKSISQPSTITTS